MPNNRDFKFSLKADSHQHLFLFASTEDIVPYTAQRTLIHASNEVKKAFKTKLSMVIMKKF